MRPIPLSGLDGSNPLGFLAALGLLRVLDARSSATERPRLSWVDEGRWRPVLHLHDNAADPVEQVIEDLNSWRDAPELGLHYTDKTGEEEVYDLKAPPGVFRAFACRAREAATPSNRRLADFAAAYATDVAVDGTGSTKPTALHFTSGQQKFVEMVRDIAAGVNAADIRETVTSWNYTSPLPVLRWDVAGERIYALSASDPSKQKAQGVPGANWLAFQALPLFPCFPVGRRVITTGFLGSGNDFRFTWPLWAPPASLAALRSLLAMPGLDRMPPDERKLRGIIAVLRSQVRRANKGYGSFCAPDPV